MFFSSYFSLEWFKIAKLFLLLKDVLASGSTCVFKKCFWRASVLNLHQRYLGHGLGHYLRGRNYKLEWKWNAGLDHLQCSVGVSCEELIKQVQASSEPKHGCHGGTKPRDGSVWGVAEWVSASSVGPPLLCRCSSPPLHSISSDSLMLVGLLCKAEVYSSVQSHMIACFQIWQYLFLCEY